LKINNLSVYSDEELKDELEAVEREIKERNAREEILAKNKSQDETKALEGLVVGQEVEDDMMVIAINPEENTFICRDNKGVEWTCYIDDYLPKKNDIKKENKDEIQIATKTKTVDTYSKLCKNECEKETSLFVQASVSFTRMHGFIRPPGDIKGLPQKRIFPKKTDIQLKITSDTVLVKRYELGLVALIKEMRSKRTAMTQFMLEEGNQILLDGNELGYQFPYDGEADVFEGAQVIAILDGTETRGQIVAVMERSIIISVKDDLGTKVEKCLLRVDNTAMIECLRERLEDIDNGKIDTFNIDLAESVIRNSGEALPGVNVAELAGEKLNVKQYEAVSKILANEVFYLWGPPGTGKTQTLSALIQRLFDAGKKVLLCSNTNQAVDQVLLKLCEQLGNNHKALIDGQILRVGKISLQELNEKWSTLITANSIVERKSMTLIKRKRELETKLASINAIYTKQTSIINDYKKRDKHLLDVSNFSTDLSNVRKKISSLMDQKEDRKGKLQNLQIEKSSLMNANAFKRVFMRNENAIEKDINDTNTYLNKVANELIELKDEARKIETQLKELTPLIEKLQEVLKTFDRKTIELEIVEVEKIRQRLTEEVTDINKQLDEITKTVFEHAKVIGATVAKSYLSRQQFRQFDVVIVDEASMVILPALFYVAGLAKEKVVISGDSRQLAPIIQTDQEEIYNAIGKDVFETAKVGGATERVIMLEEQYRMDNSICRLISSRMYKGKLRTGSERKTEKFKLPAEPFDDTLIIVDTSPIYPYVNRDHFKSRYNLMNALAVRNLCLHLAKEGFVTSNTDIGVCTPYSAQAKVLQRIIEGANIGDKIEAGTVHRYQGDQKNLMILDIPDSFGERGVSVFLEADSCHENGAKLFNVAISRAKAQLIVIANLAYLDNKLPPHSFLRGVLADIVAKGKVIDVRSVLALYPIQNELKQLGMNFKLSPSALETGLFSQKDFTQVCLVDLANAKRGIAFFSGFITEERIAVYENVIRAKIAEGVKVRIVTRPPDCNGSIPFENGKLALDSLEQWGCVVDTRGAIHEKAVIIDDEIVWFGSLNPLSHTTKTQEMMARICSKSAALQISTFLLLDRSADKKSSDSISTRKENLRCPLCSARASYRVGSYGAYWKCESCLWKENVNQAKRKKANEENSLDVPLCPECGGEMSLKNGRFGSFFSCKDYPQCQGKISLKESTSERRSKVIAK